MSHWAVTSAGIRRRAATWMPHSLQPKRLVPRLILKKPSMPHLSVQLFAQSQYLNPPRSPRETCHHSTPRHSSRPVVKPTPELVTNAAARCVGTCSLPVNGCMGAWTRGILSRLALPEMLGRLLAPTNNFDRMPPFDHVEDALVVHPALVRHEGRVHVEACLNLAAASTSGLTILLAFDRPLLSTLPIELNPSWKDGVKFQEFSHRAIKIDLLHDIVFGLQLVVVRNLVLGEWFTPFALCATSCRFSACQQRKEVSAISNFS